MSIMVRSSVYKLLPLGYTISQRLGSGRQVINYIVNNLVFPIILTLCLTKEVRLINQFHFWLIIHLVYELGYFMNDYFASDVHYSSRSTLKLSTQNINFIFYTKLVFLLLIILGNK